MSETDSAVRLYIRGSGKIRSIGVPPLVGGGRRATGNHVIAFHDLLLSFFLSSTS